MKVYNICTEGLVLDNILLVAVLVPFSIISVTYLSLSEALSK